jgi:membrane protein implicated in regulation of membrane protease activity
MRAFAVDLLVMAGVGAAMVVALLGGIAAAVDLVVLGGAAVIVVLAHRRWARTSAEHHDSSGFHFPG